MNRDRKKQREPYKLEDFCLLSHAADAKPKGPQTLADMKRVASALTLGLGGEVRKKEKPDGGN